MKHRQKFQLATEQAAEIAFKLLTIHQQVVVGVEDSTLKEVVGFGQIIISSSYHDSRFVHTPDLQKIWLGCGDDIRVIKSKIMDNLRSSRVLPMQIRQGKNIVNLDDVFREEIPKSNVTYAHKKVEELQNSCEIMVV